MGWGSSMRGGGAQKARSLPRESLPREAKFRWDTRRVEGLAYTFLIGGARTSQICHACIAYFYQGILQYRRAPRPKVAQNLPKKHTRKIFLLRFSVQGKLALSPMFSALNIVCSDLSPIFSLRNSCLLSVAPSICA